jgi:hypothetical protein
MGPAPRSKTSGLKTVLFVRREARPPARKPLPRSCFFFSQDWQKLQPRQEKATSTLLRH